MNQKYIENNSWWVFSKLYIYPLLSMIFLVIFIPVIRYLALIPVLIIMVFALKRYLLWLRSIIEYLGENYEVYTKVNKNRLEIIEDATIVATVGGLILSIWLDVSFSARSGVLLPLLLILMKLLVWILPLFQSFWAAKLLREVEEGKEQKLINCIVDIILLYISFIGIWFIQPRVNKIYNEILEEDNEQLNDVIIK